jgi:hypothetical protein
MDKLQEREIEVPASAFRAPAPLRQPSNPNGMRRRVRVPEPGEIAERERLR